MIKACLFDLDGTLLNTLTTIAHFGNYALGEQGISPIECDDYKLLVGNGAKKLIEHMLRKKGVYSDKLYESVYNCYMKAYDASPTYLTEPYDGILDMLSALRKRGIKVGVISNKPDYAAKSVCRQKLSLELIDAMQGQIEGVPIKPDVSGPMQVLKHLDALPCETIYVGDSGVDMQTGRNLKCFTVGVLWGFRSKEELMENGADIIVSSPYEIIDIADKLNNKNK